MLSKDTLFSNFRHVEHSVRLGATRRVATALALLGAVKVGSIQIQLINVQTCASDDRMLSTSNRMRLGGFYGLRGQS